MSFRPQLSLDGSWQFWTDPSASLTPTTLDPAAARTVAVPAPWQSQSPDLRQYTGVGWYQRRLDLPADWPAGRLILGFGAADYYAEVWLNGQPVGQHEGSYLPFEFDVTHAARPGANTLTVRVTDSDLDFPEVPHGKQSWYGPLSGLWQPVWLERRPALHLSRLRLTPQVAEARVDFEITLSQPAPSAASLECVVFSPEGEAVSSLTVPVAAGQDHVTASVAVDQPRLWDIDTPHLYTARATLTGAQPDTLSDTFGFRTIATHAGQLLLNGRPIYLRGALDQDYYPELACTPPSLDYIVESFRQAKAMGLNCLRVHIKVADPRYYQAADQVGVLIWTELPNWMTLTPAAMRRGRETIEGMVARDWNHPSIIIWTIINEAWGTELYGNPEHRAWLAEMYAWFKQLDPTRLIVDNSACFPNGHVYTDLNDFHYYAAIPDHHTKWRDWVESYAARSAWTHTHAYTGIGAWRQYMQGPWRAPNLQPAPQVQQRGDEPLIVSEFGNWGLPDLDQLRASHGGQDPWWFETGLDWGDATAYPRGLEARFQAYHLNRAFPTVSALTTASQRMQFLALKYEIEQMRRQPQIQGYVITEFTDLHWEANGLLDMARNPKVHYAALSQLNADDVLVPDWSRVAYWEGERCTIQLALSHYSRVDLSGSRLEWSVDGFPELSGAQTGLQPTQAGVTPLKRVSFKVPAVAHSTRARLQFQLFTAEGCLAATTYEDLYFFPRAAGAADSALKLYAPELAAGLRRLGYTLVDSLTEADLVVARTLTDELRAHLQGGGRVLWLPATPDSLQTYIGDVGVAKRAGRIHLGDWVGTFSWLNQDQLFKGLPTGGLVDFAFADLTPDHFIKGLRSIDFARNVHAGMFVGWLHRTVGLVAEQPIGRGRLLICTFRLQRNLRTQPVAAIMLRDMVNHLAS